MNTYYITTKIFGYIRSIFSKVRKGKSSFANGTINMLEIALMNKAAEDMQKVIDYFPKIDFRKVNATFLSLELNDTLFYSRQDDITKFIMSECNIENGMYNDFINCKSIEEHISDYLEAFYVYSFRGVYVYSKTWRYSFITRMTSKFLSDDTMEIKDVAIHKEFYLRKYSIVFEDELNISRGNILSHSKIEKDKGRKEHKTLFGHIYEETVYYLSVKQRSDDEISNEKYLYTDYIYIKDRTVYNDFSFFLKYFNVRNKILYYRYYIFFKITHLFRRKLDFETWTLGNKCRYRKKKYFFDSCIRYFKSLANVDVLVRCYESFKDLEKENTDALKRYEEYTLTFDLRDTIGNYDTHEYKFVRKILNALSKVHEPVDNPAYKTPELMLKQAYFLFEHIVKQYAEENENGKEWSDDEEYDF